MKRLAVGMVVCVALGCGKEEPKQVEIKINGVPVAIQERKPENDPVKAADRLAELKEKWLDESGEMKDGFRRAQSNWMGAEMSFRSVADNHPDTPAGAEAKAIADNLGMGGR